MPLIKATSNLKLAKPEEAHTDWERSHWRNLMLIDLWLEQLRRGNQVVSGGNLTQDGNDIDLDATEVQFGGSFNTFSLAASTPIVGLSTGNSYIIYIDNTGTLVATAITDAALWTQALPADFVLLGAVFEMEHTTQGVKEWVISNASNLASKPSPLPPGHISGLELANNGADAANDIDITAGACRDGADGYDLRLAATLTKQIDADWAAGDDAGGFAPAGVVQADTWYHLHLIRKNADGSIDAAFDTSITAANIPAGYSAYRRLGSVLTDGSSNIMRFVQSGGRFIWKDPPRDVYDTNPGTAALTRTMSVPPGLRVEIGLNVNISESGGATQVILYANSPETDDEGVSWSSPPQAQIAKMIGESNIVAGFKLPTDSSSQIRYRLSASGANVKIYITTLGWEEAR